MKYQVRINDTMADRPITKVFSTRKDAEKALERVRADIKKNWATPDVEAAYIKVYR